MKLTTSQLRHIIREEVGRLALAEALDPEKLAERPEDEILRTMKDVAEKLVAVADGAARGVAGARGARAAEALEAHMKVVEYSMEGLQACVDALKSKVGAGSR